MSNIYMLEKDKNVGTYILKVCLTDGLIETYNTKCYSLINALDYAKNLFKDFESQGISYE